MSPQIFRQNEDDKTVLLISTYELGHQPFNLASPQAILTQAGFKTNVCDTSITTLSPKLIQDAWFIAISIPMHTATRLAIPVLEQIRTVNPTVMVCCYGLYATLNSPYLFEHGVNFVIGGEYEAPLRDLISACYTQSFVAIPGVATPHQVEPPYLAKIPFITPKRDDLPTLDHYAQLETDNERLLAGYVETSRGCLHTCLHCPITPVYKGRFFVVPQDVVLADVANQVALGARHITFGDPDFFNGPGHGLKILQTMHRQFPALTFDCTIKVEHLLKYQRHLATLKELGCLFIVSAVESFSNIVLNKLNKGHTQADIEAALILLNETGLIMRPSFVAFTPWTTLNDYLMMFEHIETLNLVQLIDPVQYTIRLLIPPHSALLTQVAEETWLGPLQADELTYRWYHPDPRLDELYAQTLNLVETAAKRGQDTLTTFYQLKTLAATFVNSFDMALPLLTKPNLVLQTHALKTPKLTESWFC